MITEAIVKATRDFLGHDGKKFFTVCLIREGDLISTHFREGMQIRNFLRGLDDCKDWTDHDFDNNWIEIVTRAIGNESKTLPDGSR